MTEYTIKLTCPEMAYEKILHVYDVDISTKQTQIEDTIKWLMTKTAAQIDNILSIDYVDEFFGFLGLLL